MDVQMASIISYLIHSNPYMAYGDSLLALP